MNICTACTHVYVLRIPEASYFKTLSTETPQEAFFKIRSWAPFLEFLTRKVTASG